MKIDRLHQLKKEKIDLEGFFNIHHANNEFFYNSDLFLSLKGTNAKNFDDACKNPDFICVRDYVKKSYYTIASFFVKKEDEKVVIEYIKENFLKPKYEKVTATEEKAILYIIDYCKKSNIKYSSFKTKIIDFVCNNSITQTALKKYQVEIENDFLKLLEKRFTVESVNNFLKSKKKIDEKILREKNKKNKEKRLKEAEKTKYEKENREKLKKLRKKSHKQIIEYWKENISFDDIFKEYANIISGKSEHHHIDFYKSVVENKINQITNWNEPALFVCNNDGCYEKINKETMTKLENIIIELKNNISWLKSMKHKNEIVFKKIIPFFFSRMPHNIGRTKCAKKITSEIISNFYNFEKSFEEFVTIYIMNKKTKIKINYRNDIFLNISNPREFILENIPCDFLDKNPSKLFKDFCSFLTNRLNKNENLKNDWEFIKNKDIEITESIYCEKENKNIEQFIIKILQDSKQELFIEGIELTYYLNNEESSFRNNFDNALKNLITTDIQKKAILKHEMSKINYKDLYPKARSRSREIYFYSGKTNSGKTFQAFEEMKKCSSGVYLAPLRLLALEGQEEIEKRGLECSLLTGEEMDLKTNASFISSTVEMIDPNKEYDIAIIDEIQMLNDHQRGDAWLQAFAGVNAKKVIIVGSKDIRNEVFNLAEYFNENIQEVKFERKSPLVCNKGILDQIVKTKSLEAGTAIIVFSKKDVELISNQLQQDGYSTSKIYGALPPKIRRYEAERFKSGQSEILVTTDAIGMGLNLPIKNVIFYAKEKYDGVSTTDLKADLVKQIAGRAGRYGIHEVGYVIGANSKIHSFIEKQLKADTRIKKVKYSCRPIFSIIEKIKNIYNTTQLKDIYKIYNEDIHFDKGFGTQVLEVESGIALMIYQERELFDKAFSFEEQFSLTKASIKESLIDDYFKILKSVALYRTTGLDLVPLKCFVDKDSSLSVKSDYLDMITCLIRRCPEYLEYESYIEEQKEILYISWKAKIDRQKVSARKSDFNLEGKREYQSFYYYDEYDEYGNHRRYY